MKTSAVLGVASVLALLAVASVQANRQSLLETELKEADVVTKSGKEIPTSQVSFSARSLSRQTQMSPRALQHALCCHCLQCNF